MTQREIIVGEKALSYRIKRSRRKTIGLYVFRDQQVEVRVPYFCSFAEADAFVQQRHEWIVRKQEEFANNKQVRFENDESRCYFLGQSLELDFYSASRYKAELDGGVLRLGVREVDDQTLQQQAILRWYKDQAQEIFKLRLDTCWIAFADKVANKPSLKLRKMKSRWGSCSRDGVITLSTELIRAPYPLIDYVITHELCHLLEFNHSPSFYKLMDEAMPDWPERREQLKQWS